MLVLGLRDSPKPQLTLIRCRWAVSKHPRHACSLPLGVTRPPGILSPAGSRPAIPPALHPASRPAPGRPSCTRTHLRWQGRGLVQPSRPPHVSGIHPRVSTTPTLGSGKSSVTRGGKSQPRQHPPSLLFPTSVLQAGILGRTPARPCTLLNYKVRQPKELRLHEGGSAGPSLTLTCQDLRWSSGPAVVPMSPVGRPAIRRSQDMQ